MSKLQASSYGGWVLHIWTLLVDAHQMLTELREWPS
jgi:hypothetical protein